MGRLKQIQQLMKNFEVAPSQHIPRELNKEADALANQEKYEIVVGGIKFQEPQMQGEEDL